MILATVIPRRPRSHSHIVCVIRGPSYGVEGERVCVQNYMADPREHPYRYTSMSDGDTVEMDEAGDESMLIEHERCELRELLGLGR